MIWAVFGVFVLLDAGKSTLCDSHSFLIPLPVDMRSLLGSILFNVVISQGIVVIFFVQEKCVSTVQ